MPSGLACDSKISKIGPFFLFSQPFCPAMDLSARLDCRLLLMSPSGAALVSASFSRAVNRPMGFFELDPHRYRKMRRN